MSDQSLAQHKNTRTTPRYFGPNSSGQERLHAQTPPLSMRLRFATRRAQDLASSQHDQQMAPKKPRDHRASDCLHRPRLPLIGEPAAARGRRSAQYQDRYEISRKLSTFRRKTTAPSAPPRRPPSFCHATARALEARAVCPICNIAVCKFAASATDFPSQRTAHANSLFKPHQTGDPCRQKKSSNWLIERSRLSST